MNYKVLTNVALELVQEHTYDANESYKTETAYSIQIKIPLPGGAAQYKIPVTKSQYESLSYAHDLAERTKEKNSLDD